MSVSVEQPQSLSEQLRWGSCPKTYNYQKPKSVGYTLPASWFTNDAVFELERRAVFGSSWLYHSVSLRYKSKGDSLEQTIAGFRIKVTATEIGNDAPQFEAELVSDGSEGFKARPVAVHILHKAFIFVNCDASEDGPKSFDEGLPGITEYMSSFPFNPKDYELAYTAEIPGNFNWKVFCDNYNECYHCPTGHPGFSRVYDIPSYVINNESSFSVHNVGYRDQSQGKQPQFKAELPDRFPADILELYEKIYTVPHKFLETLPTKAELTGNKADADKGQEFATDQPGIFVYVMPNVGFNGVGNFFTTLRWTPVSANQTVLHAEAFFIKGSTSREEFKEFLEFFYEVDIEDYFLASFTHKNLVQGVYSQGCLNPKVENALIYYQNTVKKAVTEHAKKEKEAGKPIKPWLKS